jgi:hypothetical protein
VSFRIEVIITRGDFFSNLPPRLIIAVVLGSFISLLQLVLCDFINGPPSNGILQGLFHFATLFFNPHGGIFIFLDSDWGSLWILFGKESRDAAA